MIELSLKNTTLFISTILTALSAGLFYAWVISVIPGTKKISDQAYIETMQSINREIINIGFLSIFFGALFFLIVTSVAHFQTKVDMSFYLTLSATLFYLMATVGVTMFGNVPLNNIIESFDLTTFSEIDYKHARLAYEEKWNRLNMIRTVGALISFVLVLWALVRT